MPLSPGSRIGSYEIVSMLGAGGMGEVYRARDSKLKREVAIKVLPDVLAGDPDRLARFQREAELLATLNHPNIAAVYGLEDQGSARAIILELIEGATLEEQIRKGPIAMDEALRIARQIVDALEAAHDRGVIHRDLKPANIKVTPDGNVKVLDFGLAKMLESEAQASALSMSPTISLHATYAGVILGTAAYMSPEQARGKLVDRRTDIWAFGCVVFEMLTGKRVFDPAGDTVSDAVAAVLTQEPDWRALPAATPPHIVGLLRRCLQKDARKRLPHIGVARLDIDEGPPVSLSPASAASSARPIWRRALPVAMAVLLTTAVAGASWWRFRSGPAPQAVTRFTVTLPEGQGFTSGGRQIIGISPDGRQIVYVANFRLYLRAMADLEARLIGGPDSGTAVTNPVFSPDGASIAFYSGDNTIKRIAATGGAAMTLGSFTNPMGMSWGPDGILLGQPPQGILRVPPGGGTPEVIVKAKDDEILYGPQMLPGGNVVLFTVAKARSGTSVAVWDKAQVVVQRLPSGDRKMLFEGGSDARYLPSGHIVYTVGGIVFAVPFDVEHLSIAGVPVSVVEGVARSAGAATAATQLSVSANGTLAFLPGPVALNGDGRELVIFDRKGAGTPLNVPPANIQHPRVSPDGKRVAFFIENDKESVVWTYELSGSTAMRRITFGGNSRFPIWSADGQYIAFQSDREGDAGIFRQRADGAGTAERLTKADSGTTHIPESWSPKGDGLLFRASKGGRNLLMFYAMKDNQASPFGAVAAGAPTDARFSPDGRWVAYESGELAGSGRSINVQPFPATGATYQLPVVEVGGYRHPTWSADGRELFYMIGGMIRFLSAGITTQPAFAFGNPVRLGKPRSWLDNFDDNTTQYDVMPDGQHFIARVVPGTLAQAGAEQAVKTPIQVVVNWFEELKQRVPAK
jgi:eukaryotic-like serine/threonine-protein kinase